MILSADRIRWYRSKHTILLDGAFDPLHLGHLKYIAQATALFPSHLMIVTVASDDDIRAKGREPLFDQQTRCALVAGLKAVDLVVPKEDATEIVLGQLRPSYYIKGKDWEGTLPAEQTAACSLYGIPIVYLDTVTDSSSDALRRWALRDAERGLDRLETFISKQTAPSVPWQPVTDYSFEARKIVEGRHPKLIKEVFQPTTITDAGCGPGHLVTMLRDLGLRAYGIDSRPYPDWYGHPSRQPNEIVPFEEYRPIFDVVDLSDGCGVSCCEHGFAWPADLVICREVLEHLTVEQVGRAVANLFKLSSKYVYITTRFTNAGVFDAATEFDADPTHITCLSQPFLRALCVLNGGKRRRDLETRLDWQKKGRCLVYEIQ